MVEIVQFFALLLYSLVMGIHFGSWLLEGPLRRTQSGPRFVEVHQGRDRVAARVVPILGQTALIFLALDVFFVRTVPVAFALSLAGLLLFIGDSLVTVKVNTAINRTMQTWQASSLPADWKPLRDRWERFHSIRTLLIVPGFALFAASVVFFELR
jgi:hypothetical protein